MENSILTPSDEKKVYLVLNELYKAYIKSPKEEVSFYKIINIILLLFQKPIALVLYEEVVHQSIKKYRVIFKTFEDPVLKTPFNKHLSKISNFSRGDNPYIKEDLIENCLHVIPGSKYGFAIFHASNKKGKIVFETIKKSTEANKSRYSVNLEKLCSLLISSPYAKKIELKKNLESVFSQISSQKKYSNNSIPSNLFKIYSESENTSNSYENIEKILDDVYITIRNTPIISAGKKFPPNVLFFYRFSGSEHIERHNGYNYDISFMLPPTQEKDVRRVFETIRKDRESFFLKVKGNDGGEYEDMYKNKLWKYPVTIIDDEKENSRSVIHYEEKERYYHDLLDDAFLKILFDEENGIDIIIKSLRSPFTDKASSLADPVMSTGIMYIRRNPFSGGGRERLNINLSQHLNLKAKENIDVLRVVSMHYLMSAMSPSSTNESLRLLLMPVRVDGSTAFCMGTMGVGDSKATEEDNRGEANWDTFFHFFTNIGQKCIRKIRNGMEEKYVEEFRGIVKKSFIDNSRKQGGNFVIRSKKLINDINKGLVQISAFYPYGIIYFLDDDKDILKKDGNVVNIGGLKLHYNVLNNPYYVDKMVNYRFIFERIIRSNLDEIFKDGLFSANWLLINEFDN